MDKIDAGDNDGEYDALFMGVVSEGRFTINYGGKSRAVPCRADGKGGAALQELYTPTWGENKDANPFYDEENATFSIKAYLDNYRTMDDAGERLVTASSNPSGENVVGSDGKTYQIGKKITSQSLLYEYDVCTPTHIFVNLVHNTSADNYKQKIADVVSIIKTDVPNVPVCLMTIDETGTYFPIDYPNYDENQISIGSLHTKNCGIYNYIKENIEDENNGIYLLGLHFIQPTAESYPTIGYSFADGIEDEKAKQFQIKNPDVAGANYHPSNKAHAAWGYALYSFLKWIMSK